MENIEKQTEGAKERDKKRDVQIIISHSYNNHPSNITMKQANVRKWECSRFLNNVICFIFFLFFFLSFPLNSMHWKLCLRHKGNHSIWFILWTEKMHLMKFGFQHTWNHTKPSIQKLIIMKKGTRITKYKYMKQQH